MNARQALTERFAHVERQCDAMDRAVDRLTIAGYDASLHVAPNTIPEFLLLFLDVIVNGKLAVSATWICESFTVQPHGKTQRNKVLAQVISDLLNEDES